MMTPWLNRLTSADAPPSIGVRITAWTQFGWLPFVGAPTGTRTTEKICRLSPDTRTPFPAMRETLRRGGLGLPRRGRARVSCCPPLHDQDPATVRGRERGHRVFERELTRRARGTPRRPVECDHHRVVVPVAVSSRPVRHEHDTVPAREEIHAEVLVARRWSLCGSPPAAGTDQRLVPMPSPRLNTNQRPLGESLPLMDASVDSPSGMRRITGRPGAGSCAVAPVGAAPVSRPMKRIAKREGRMRHFLQEFRPDRQARNRRLSRQEAHHSRGIPRSPSTAMRWRFAGGSRSERPLRAAVTIAAIFRCHDAVPLE